MIVVQHGGPLVRLVRGGGCLPGHRLADVEVRAALLEQRKGEE